MTEASTGSFWGTSFDAVVFDFDGTLADSHEAMIRSYELWAREFNVSLDRLPAYLGMPSAATSAALLPASDVEAATARIEELETTDTAGVVALPGSLATLELLPADRVAIATSCTSGLLYARMAAAGLPLPAVIVTRDQVVEGKPAPDSFLLAAERLGFDSSRVLVVEDAPAGIAGARAAGCAVLGISSTLPPDKLHADAVVGDLSEVEWKVADDGAISLHQKHPHSGSLG